MDRIKGGSNWDQKKDNCVALLRGALGCECTAFAFILYILYIHVD